ncbi:hypothetical protein IG631_06110 [Alternaria alternata]|nr:hypothetical protein IG631_06110 [Alternaria alternata]
MGMLSRVSFKRCRTEKNNSPPPRGARPCRASEWSSGPAMPAQGPGATAIHGA